MCKESERTQRTHFRRTRIDHPGENHNFGSFKTARFSLSTLDISSNFFRFRTAVRPALFHVGLNGSENLRMLEAVFFAGSNLHRDNVEFPLSAVQLEVFDAWRRPRELLGQFHSTSAWYPTTLAHCRVDLVQDITTDCSVVASLCAVTARKERGNTDVMLDRLSCIIFGLTVS